MNKELATLINNLEIELLQPDARSSVERLNELLADDFFELGASGKRYSRQEAVNTLPNVAGAKYTMHDFEAREISPETVLATYRVEKEVIGSGEKSWSVRSSLWQNRNGLWQIIFHHGTLQE